MKRIKVLLAVEPPMLAEALCERLERQNDVEVANGLDPVDLLVAIGRSEADVVIQSWPETGEMPSVCSHMFLEFPHLVVVGLVGETGRAVVCRQEVSKTELPAMGLDELLSALPQPAVGAV